MRPRISARSTQLRTLNFTDARVEAWHEGPSDSNGGALLSNGSITLTRSRLTAAWTWFFNLVFDLLRQKGIIETVWSSILDNLRIL